MIAAAKHVFLAKTTVSFFSAPQPLSPFQPFGAQSWTNDGRTGLFRGALVNADFNDGERASLYLVELLETPRV